MTRERGIFDLQIILVLVVLHLVIEGAPKIGAHLQIMPLCLCSADYVALKHGLEFIT